MIAVADLARSPNALAPHYARFRVAERLLLTGHSHQAWPDVARLGQIAAFDDAAEAVDDKWERAFVQAERVREGYRRLFEEPRAEIALAASTHELLGRFLSALDLERRPKLVTTDGEFHTARRQLARLAESGLDVVRVRARPVATLAERLAAEVDDRTAAVLVSAVLFETAEVVPQLSALAERLEAPGVELWVDAYHALGAIPFPIGALGLDSAWVVGGGYKYLQLGEGNCCLRLPAQAASMRPIQTGWFAEFALLERRAEIGEVDYPTSPAARFAGSTYDPTSHYRAARVFALFGEQGLTAELLRAVSLHQVGRLARRFDGLAIPPGIVSRPDLAASTRAGFLALETPHAENLVRALARRGLASDCRDRWLRLGPAPYLCDAQLDRAIEVLGEVVREELAASG